MKNKNNKNKDKKKFVVYDTYIVQVSKIIFASSAKKAKEQFEENLPAYFSDRRYQAELAERLDGCSLKAEEFETDK